MLFCLAVLIVSLTVPEPAPRVVTPLDYFDNGRQEVEAYFRSTGLPNDEIEDTLVRLRSFCARVQVRYEHHDRSFRSTMGSGVLVGNGRFLLTAGHLVAGMEDAEIHVTLANGEKYTASLMSHEYEVFGGATDDWAILMLDRRASRGSLIEATDTKLGTRAIVLGYPDHVGITRDGEIVFGENRDWLEPITTVGTVSDEDPLTLVPHAGSVPTGGMSGAPVFDSSGRLLGIFVAVLREPGSQTDYSYRIVPIDALPGMLETLKH